MAKIDERTLSKLSDEELVEYYQNGNNDAIGIIYTRYKGLIVAITSDYLKTNNLAQMYFDDFFDIAVECLFRAMDTYDLNKETHLKNYWWTFVKRSFINKHRHIAHIESIVIDPSQLESGRYHLMDSSINDKRFNVDEFIDDILLKYPDEFTNIEKRFLIYLKDGFEIKEIAFFMGTNLSKVYRLRLKVLDKLNKIIKSN